MRAPNEGLWDLAGLGTVQYFFQRQPAPIPADLWTVRRVPLLLFLLEKAWGGRLNGLGLHVLSWLTKDADHASAFRAYREGRWLPHIPAVRFEPALDRAIDLSIGLGYAEVTNAGSIRLTDAGRGVVTQLMNYEVFSRERELLASLAGKVTQTEVRAFLKVRRR